MLEDGSLFKSWAVRTIMPSLGGGCIQNRGCKGQIRRAQPHRANQGTPFLTFALITVPLS